MHKAPVHDAITASENKKIRDLKELVKRLRRRIKYLKERLTD
jgi:hypothetical protein